MKVTLGVGEDKQTEEMVLKRWHKSQRPTHSHSQESHKNPKLESVQVSSQTAEGEQADCRSNTASGKGKSDTASEADPSFSYRHLGTIPARGELDA